MSGEQFMILGYVVGTVAIWGYGALLWIEARSLRKRETNKMDT